MTSPTDRSDLYELLDNHKAIAIHTICDAYEDSSNSSTIEKKISDTTETDEPSNVLDRSILEEDFSKREEFSGENQTETNVLNKSMMEESENNQTPSLEKENDSRYDNPFFVSKRLSGMKNAFENFQTTPARKSVLSEVNVQNTPMYQKTPMEKKIFFTKQTNHSVTFPELKLNLFAPPESPNYSNQEENIPFENPFCNPNHLCFSNHTYSGKKNLFSTFEKTNFKTPIRTKKVEPEPQNNLNTPLPQNILQNKKRFFQMPKKSTISKCDGQNHPHSVTFPEIAKTSIENLPNHKFKTPNQPDIDEKKEIRHFQKETSQIEEPRPKSYQNDPYLNEFKEKRSPDTLTLTQNKHIEHQNSSGASKNQNKKYSIDGPTKQNGGYHEKHIISKTSVEEKKTSDCAVFSKKTIQTENQILSPIIEDCARENMIRIKVESRKIVKVLEFVEEENVSPILEPNKIKIPEIILPECEQNYNSQPVSNNKNVKRLFKNDQDGYDFENKMAAQDEALNNNFQSSDKLVSVISERRMSQPPQSKPIIPNPPKDNFVKSANKISGSVVRDFKTLVVKKKAYILISKLGEGGTCQVFDCLEPDTLQHRAIKIVNLSMDTVTASGCVNEVKMLKALQGSEYVIKIFDYEINNNTLFVVMEKGGIDLSIFLRNIAANKCSFSPIHIINYYWMEMLNCVKEIHEAGIIHSDLKPSNFLIVDGRLKLIDFGIASRLSSDMTSIIKNVQVGTFNYISPEALLDSRGGNSPGQDDNRPRIKISYKSDVWSLGCILYQLVYSKTPFHNVGNTFAKISMIMDPSHRIEYPNLRHVPHRIIDTIRKCLQYDMKIRPTVNELIAMSNPE